MDRDPPPAPTSAFSSAFSSKLENGVAREFTELFTNQQPFLEISNNSTDLLVTSLPQSIGRQGSVGCGPSAVAALPPAVIHGRHGGRRLPRPRGRPWRQRAGAGAAASAEPGQSSIYRWFKQNRSFGQMPQAHSEISGEDSVTIETLFTSSHLSCILNGPFSIAKVPVSFSAV